MSDKIRIGMIGAGGIAGTHVRYLKPIQGVEVIALADPRAGACENLAKQQGLSDVKMFTDYHDLLALQEIDAVSVCTPNWLHAKPTIEALKAGKHVMVEKPLAMNAKEGAAMCEAARRAKRVLSIGFQHRFRPEAQFLRRLVAEGALGEIVYCRAQALRRRGIPSWGVFGQKKLQGGGPLIDIGVHILELSHFIMGKPQPLAASSACYTYLGNRKPQATPPWGEWDYKTYTVEDLATGFVRFRGGLSLVIESSFAAHIEKDVFTTTILGTKGGAVMGDEGVKVFTDMSGKMVNIAPAFLGKDEAFAVKMRSWIEAIRGGENPAPGEDGLAIQKILDALYDSAEKAREVAIR